jgi:hypothetical protein
MAPRRRSALKQWRSYMSSTVPPRSKFERTHRYYVAVNAHPRQVLPRVRADPTPITAAMVSPDLQYSATIFSSPSAVQTPRRAPILIRSIPGDVHQFDRPRPSTTIRTVPNCLRSRSRGSRPVPARPVRDICTRFPPHFPRLCGAGPTNSVVPPCPTAHLRMHQLRSCITVQRHSKVSRSMFGSVPDLA